MKMTIDQVNIYNAFVNKANEINDEGTFEATVKKYELKTPTFNDYIQIVFQLYLYDEQFDILVFNVYDDGDVYYVNNVLGVNLKINYNDLLNGLGRK